MAGLLLTLSPSIKENYLDFDQNDKWRFQYSHLKRWHAKQHPEQFRDEISVSNSTSDSEFETWQLVLVICWSLMMRNLILLLDSDLLSVDHWSWSWSWWWQTSFCSWRVICYLLIIDHDHDDDKPHSALGEWSHKTRAAPHMADPPLTAGGDPDHHFDHYDRQIVKLSSFLS